MMGVKEVAAHFGISGRTLRWYHQIGVCPGFSHIQPRGWLSYGPYELARVACLLELRFRLGSLQKARVALEILEKHHLLVLREDVVVEEDQDYGYYR